MKKFIKIFLWTVLTFVVLLLAAGSLLVYKIKNGFPVSYETQAPTINFPAGQTSVLLFSKSTGYRHATSIDAGKRVFDSLAKKNNWFVYSTEEGGVFNKEQLAKFNVVVFNNSTGRVLNDEQEQALEHYVEQGGRLIGIHGAGDDSHHWDWYEHNLLGSKFSHHPIAAHLQKTAVVLNEVPDSAISSGLAETWESTDEWYVFFENPRAKGFHVLFNIDGSAINPSGNIFFVKDKNFGMGKDHPVAWYKNIGKGSTFYTSMGHDETIWGHEPFNKMIENAVNWKLALP